MFGRRQRREERLYWEGFRDALVTGVAVGPAGRPALFKDDEPPANWTKYRRGFEDGKLAAQRVHRDALVSEVSRLSLKPGDKLVVKVRGSAGRSKHQPARTTRLNPVRTPPAVCAKTM